jgi:hypothetical protein
MPAIGAMHWNQRSGWALLPVELADCHRIELDCLLARHSSTPFLFWL